MGPLPQFACCILRIIQNSNFVFTGTRGRPLCAAALARRPIFFSMASFFWAETPAQFMACTATPQLFTQGMPQQVSAVFTGLMAYFAPAPAVVESTMARFANMHARGLWLTQQVKVKSINAFSGAEGAMQ